MSPAFDSSSPAAAAESAASPSTAPTLPSFPPPPEGVERGSGGNVAVKKPAWNVPMNGTSEGGTVMGADSWPALSESAKGLPKSVPLETPKAVADRSNAAPAGSMTATSQSKPDSFNPDPGFSQNVSIPARQKPNIKPNSMKRGNGSPVNGAPATVQSSMLEHSTPVGLDLGSESSPRGFPQGKNNWERNSGGGFAPQHHGRGDHRGGYNGNRSERNGNGGASHQGGFGKRQDYDFGSYGRSTHGFSGDPRAPMPLPQQQSYPRPFIRPPPPARAPFISMPLQVRPFVGPMGFPDAPPVYYVPSHPPLEQLRNVPLGVHQAPPAIAPVVDNHRVMLVKQIEYYFSNENLCKDVFLKQNMDDQGWVPISLIANFNRIEKLREVIPHILDIPYILDAVRDSEVVEVQGDKIRRRNDWKSWILPPSLKQYGIRYLPQSLVTSDSDADSDSLAVRVKNVGLAEGASCRNSLVDRTNNELVLGSASEDLNDQMQNGGQAVMGMSKPQATKN